MNVFVSLVCVCDEDPNRELSEMSAALQRRFPLHEIIASVRLQGTRPTLPNLHVLTVAPPADDRARLAAAVDHALGDVVVIADPSVDDPHAVLQAASLVAAGTPAVYELPSDRGMRRWTRQRTHAVLSRVAGVSVPPIAGVRACNREVLSELLGNPDRDRLLEVFPAITGYPWDRLPSRTRTTPHRPIRWHVSALMAASAQPLRLAYFAALAGAVLNLLYSAYVVGLNLIRGDTVEGWTSLSLQLAGMFFLVSLILAILAEYIFQVIKRGRERPPYRIRDEAMSPSLPVREHLNVEQSAGDRD